MENHCLMDKSTINGNFQSNHIVFNSRVASMAAKYVKMLQGRRRGDERLRPKCSMSRVKPESLARKIPLDHLKKNGVTRTGFATNK